MYPSGITHNIMIPEGYIGCEHFACYNVTVRLAFPFALRAAPRVGLLRRGRMK